MKLTIVQFTLEGLVDTDRPPRVFQDHLDKEQCTKLAAGYGSDYPVCALVKCENEKATFYANYSNVADCKFDEDGAVNEDDKGHLEVWFYHTEQEPSPIPLFIVESMTSDDCMDPDDIPMCDEGNERYWGAFEDSPVPHIRVWVRFNREPNSQEEAEEVARAYFGE